MKLLRIALAMLTMCFLVFFIGCNNNKDTTAVNPNTVDTTGAELKVLQANDALGTVLTNLINESPGPQRPSQVDLHVPYNLYIQALALDPNNRAANFGAGMLELVMLSQDSTTNHDFDTWKAFGDSNNSFVVGAPGSFRKSPSIGPILQGSEIALPFFSGISMMKGITNYNRIQTTDPQFSQMQDFFTGTVIPKIDIMLARLQLVTLDPNFQFVVTRQMQGNDPNEDDVILDLTEVNATIAGLNGIKAMMLQMSSYNMDFSAYTGAGMQAALSQGSSFLTLRSSGAANLTTAHACWLNAADALDSAIYHLEHETGNTSNHLIKFDTHNGLTHADVDSMKAYLPRVRNALNSSETFLVDADGDSSTPKINLQVSLHAVLINPISDMKALFPAYTVSLDTAEQTNYGEFHDTVGTNIALTSPLNWSRQANFDHGVMVYADSFMSHNVPTFNTYWNAKVAQYQNYPSAQIWMQCRPFFSNSGTYHVVAEFNANYHYVQHYRVQPVITWTATSYSNWILPNPTINGLFPGMTDASFKTDFGMNGNGWTRTRIFHLWN